MAIQIFLFKREPNFYFTNNYFKNFVISKSVVDGINQSIFDSIYFSIKRGLFNIRHLHYQSIIHQYYVCIFAKIIISITEKKN